MKIAIDKNCINISKKNSNEYIYLYDNEEYNDLLKLNLHCINYKYCDYVDINLTEYQIDCIKKAKELGIPIISEEEFVNKYFN